MRSRRKEKVVAKIEEFLSSIITRNLRYMFNRKKKKKSNVIYVRELELKFRNKIEVD